MSDAGGEPAGSDPGHTESRPGSSGQRRPVVREVRATVRNWLPYVGLTTAFFLAVAVAGAVVGHATRSRTIPVVAPGDPLPALAPLDLFVHDVQVAALLIVGVLFGALPTVALLGYNAFLLGASIATATASFGPVATLSILLPHGIFELPAIWLTGAISVRLIHVTWRTVRGTERRVSMTRTARETVLALLVVALLLGIGALVEATVTEDLARGLVQQG